MVDLDMEDTEKDRMGKREVGALNFDSIARSSFYSERLAVWRNLFCALVIVFSLVIFP